MHAPPDTHSPKQDGEESRLAGLVSQQLQHRAQHDMPAMLCHTANGTSRIVLRAISGPDHLTAIAITHWVVGAEQAGWAKKCPNKIS
jgi:hypothetical protein